MEPTGIMASFSLASIAEDERSYTGDLLLAKRLRCRRVAPISAIHAENEAATPVHAEAHRPTPMQFPSQFEDEIRFQNDQPAQKYL